VLIRWLFELERTVTHPNLPPLPEARIESYQIDGTMRKTTLRTYSEFDMREYGRLCASQRQDSQALPEPGDCGEYGHDKGVCGNASCLPSRAQAADPHTEIERARKEVENWPEPLKAEAKKTGVLAFPRDSASQAAPVQPSDAEMDQIADAIRGAQKKRLPMTAAIQFARAVLGAHHQAAEARKPTPIDQMCRILEKHAIKADEYTDCAIVYKVTFDQLRRLYDDGIGSQP
jgi:hypothetical protein